MAAEQLLRIKRQKIPVLSPSTSLRRLLSEEASEEKIERPLKLLFKESLKRNRRWFISGDNVAFVELDDKDWDKMIKKEDMGLDIKEVPIKNIKNHFQDSKNATKNSKIGVLGMMRNKIEKTMAMGEDSKLSMVEGEENPLIYDED